MKKYQKQIEFLNGRITALSGKLENAVSDEARAEIESRISELREIADTLEGIRDAAVDGTDDKSEEMRAQMREVLARVKSVENMVHKETAANGVKVTNTKDYERKFYNAVMNSMDRDEFRTNMNKLAVENGIVINEGTLEELLPAAVLREVNDIFTGHRHRLLELVDWTGLPAFKAFFETGNELGNAWPSFTAGMPETPKTQQNLAFNDIVIRPQFVYKTISLDKDIIKASEADGSVFVRYIVRELLDRLLCTIENYILNPKGQKNFLPAKLVAPVMDSSNNPIYNALAYLPNNNGLIAICTPSFYIREKQRLMATYGYYISDEFMAKDYFGVNEVLLTPPNYAVPSTFDSGGELFFLNPRAYKMVGDRRPDQYEDFNLEYNRVQYLMEMWVGGGCVTNEFVVIGEAGK